jgi:hypothetical protein
MNQEGSGAREESAEAIAAPATVPWHRPCPQCRFDLYGREIGGCCPDCGWLIEGAMPEWWLRDPVARVERAAGRAKRAAYALLFVIVATPIGVLVNIMADSLALQRFSASLFPLMLIGALVVQIFLQVVAIETLAQLPIGEQRTTRLRRANGVRVIGFAIAALLLLIDPVTWIEAGGNPALVAAVLSFCVPITIAVADLLALVVLRSLPSESGWRDTPGAEFAAKAAPVLVAASGLIALVPFIGWVVAPVLWAIGVGQGLGALERFARQIQSLCRAS